MISPVLGLFFFYIVPEQMCFKFQQSLNSIQNMTFLGNHEKVPDRGLIEIKETQDLRICIYMYSIFSKELVQT